MPQRSFGAYAEEAVVPSAARAAGGDSGVHSGYGVASTLRVQLDVTALTVAAGNTLDVVLEDTLDGINWNPIATFAQKTAVGREVLNVTTPFADRLRVRWTVGGAANPTFSVVMASQVPEVA
jgi:hypothetical protein